MLGSPERGSAQSQQKVRWCAAGEQHHQGDIVLGRLLGILSLATHAGPVVPHCPRALGGSLDCLLLCLTTGLTAVCSPHRSALRAGPSRPGVARCLRPPTPPGGAAESLWLPTGCPCGCLDWRQRMHLLLQHLVKLRNPNLVSARMAPMRAIILLLHHHTQLSIEAPASAMTSTAVRDNGCWLGGTAGIHCLLLAAECLKRHSP